jgi:hypothetical protein
MVLTNQRTNLLHPFMTAFQRMRLTDGSQVLVTAKITAVLTNRRTRDPRGPDHARETVEPRLSETGGRDLAVQPPNDKKVHRVGLYLSAASRNGKLNPPDALNMFHHSDLN